MPSRLGLLAGYGEIKWQQTFADLEKALDFAYQDVLNKFDSPLGGGQRSYRNMEQFSGHLKG